jgi:predicted PurR-regulated permease PerM
MNLKTHDERGAWWPVLLTATVTFGALYMVRSTLPPVLLAGIMAYLLNPFVDFGERRALPRWAVIGLIYLIIVGLIIISVFYLVPALINQLTDIQRELRSLWPLVPAYLDVWVDWARARFPSAVSTIFGDEPLGVRVIAGAQSWITSAIAQAPTMLTSVISNIANFLLYFVMVPFIAFFLLRDGRAFKMWLIQLVPNRYFETTLHVVGGIGESVGWYLRGLLIQATILATAASIGLSIAGVKYAVIIGIVAGVVNMIPYIGPTFGILIGVMIVVTTGEGSILGILIVFGIAQFIDNWLVAPVVMSRSVKLHPLIVFLAVILGGTYAGILGMFLAIPVTGAAFVTFRRMREGLKPPVYATEP